MTRPLFNLNDPSSLIGISICMPAKLNLHVANGIVCYTEWVIDLSRLDNKEAKCGLSNWIIQSKAKPCLSKIWLLSACSSLFCLFLFIMLFWQQASTCTVEHHSFSQLDEHWRIGCHEVTCTEGHKFFRAVVSIGFSVKCLNNHSIEWFAKEGFIAIRFALLGT